MTKLFVILLLAFAANHINAQYGEYGPKDDGFKGGPYGGYGGGGYGGGGYGKEVVGGGYGKEVIGGGYGKEVIGGGYGKEVIGGGYGKEIVPVKEVAIKPAVIKPPIVPYVKPVVTSYQKIPFYGGHGGYGGGYGGKVIPITKLLDYRPKLDINQFIRPYEGAHLLKKYAKPEIIHKEAPPVFLTLPPIEKVIHQRVFVEQPVLVKEQPVIFKNKKVLVEKKPPIVKINEKAPVDVKDYGQTAVVKEHGVAVEKPILKEKEFGYGGEKLE